MLRWLLYGLVGIVVLVLVITVVGLLLPKGHHVSRTATFKAPPSDVYGAITNFAKYSVWRRDVKRVEMIADDGHGMRFRELGDHGGLTFRIEVREPHTRVVTRIDDAKAAFGGSWTYDLKPNGTGTDLTITEDGEVYNPIFRFMSKFFISNTKTIENYQEDLKRHMGEGAGQ